MAIKQPIDKLDPWLEKIEEPTNEQTIPTSPETAIEEQTAPASPETATEELSIEEQAVEKD